MPAFSYDTYFKILLGYLLIKTLETNYRKGGQIFKGGKRASQNLVTLKEEKSS